MEEGILKRFTNKRLLAEALQRQLLIGGREELSRLFVENGDLLKFDKGQALISFGAPDNDIFFILAGSVDVLINSRVVAVREPGEHVGEMALIDPTASRSADVVANQVTVAYKVSEEAFSQIAKSSPTLWRAIGTELAHRLRQRDTTVVKRNIEPHLFVGSSKEMLDVSRNVQSFFRRERVRCKVWTDGIFSPSSFTLESLSDELTRADFALIVLGPDDVIFSRGVESLSPRDNTLFELGLFMGALSRSRTFILKPRDQVIKIPTDLLGLTLLEYDHDISNLEAEVAPACFDLLKRIRALGAK